MSMTMVIKSATHGDFVLKIDKYIYDKYFKNKTIGVSKCSNWVYPHIIVKRKTVRLYKIIMQRFGKFKVDHIDGDGMNNCLSNLRICDDKQNAQNAKIQKNNKSGYKGVCWCNRTNKYRVSISANSKYMSFGYYDDVIIAAKKYNEVAILYHGKFAKLNNI